jgi:hypothetical protein
MQFWNIKQKQDWLLRGELAPEFTFWNSGGVGYVPVRGYADPGMINVIYDDWVDYQQTGDPLLSDTQLADISAYLRGTPPDVMSETLRTIRGIPDDDWVYQKTVKYYDKGGWDWGDAWDATWGSTGGAAGQVLNDAYDNTLGGLGQSINDLFGGVGDWFGTWGPIILIVIVGLVALWIYKK